MPNRVLRDWTDSDSIHKLSAHAERFLTRLIMKADDFGRFHASVKLLKAALFPYLIDEVTDADITTWLDECVQAGIVSTYAIDDRCYLEIHKFDQRVRQQKAKFPPPLNKVDGQLTVNCQSTDGQLSDNGQSIDGLKEKKGNQEETEEEKKPSCLNDDFLNKFLSPEGLPDNQRIARGLGEPEIKRRWGEVFNTYLHFEDKHHTSYLKWVQHLRSWLPTVLKKLKADDGPPPKPRNYLN